MILYVNFEVNDMLKSAQFYDNFLGELNAKRVLDREDFIAWGVSVHDTYLCITQRESNDSGFVGNDTIVALAVNSKKEVDSLFAKGIELGATSEVPVGLKDHDVYSGCIRDFNGHRIRILCVTAG